MAEYFAGGHLRFLKGEWRDDNGDIVEIQEVKHGFWKEYFSCGEYHYDCSNCDFGYKSKEWQQKVYTRCPECGAIMDRGDE